MTDQPHPSYGTIIRLLVQLNKLTPLQVEHALRIQAKLTSYQPLLKILKDLKLVADQDVKEALSGTSSPIRIGDLLTELGYLSPDDLEAACRIQQESDTREKLGRILVKHNFIDEQVFIEVLSIQMGYPFIEPSLTNIDRTRCDKVPRNLLALHCFLPIKSEEGSIRVAFADPLDQEAVQSAKRYFGPGVTRSSPRNGPSAKLLSSCKSGKAAKPWRWTTPP